MQQDSSDPSGVRDDSPRGNKEVARARMRKTNAALQLRLAGATWEEVALAVGYPTARQALVAVERSLERQLNEADRTKMRQIAGLRLERLLRGVWNKAIDPENPEHLAAVTKAREVIAQYSKLYGLDAPTEITFHSPTQAELEKWVATVVSAAVPELEEADILEGEWEEGDEGDAGVPAVV